MLRSLDDERSCVDPALTYSRHRISQSLLPRGPAKRRKTDGLNSRFDRMVETVNVIHTSTTDARTRRRRATSGSSSTMSYEGPKTPIDAYSELEGGRLGKDFSVIKLKTVNREDHNAFGGGKPGDCPLPPDAFRSIRQVPEWLSSTVSSLNSEHPLRELIPTHDAHIPDFPVQHSTAISMTTGNEQNASEEENIFAFHAPDEPPGHLASLPEHDYNVTLPTSSRFVRPSVTLSSFGLHVGTGSLPEMAHTSSLPAGGQSLEPFTQHSSTKTAPGIIDREDHDLESDYEDEMTNRSPFSTPGPLVRQIQDSAIKLHPRNLSVETAPHFPRHGPSLTLQFVRPFSTPGPLAQSAVLPPSFRTSDEDYASTPAFGQPMLHIEYANEPDPLSMVSDDGPALSELNPTSSSLAPTPPHRIVRFLNPPVFEDSPQKQHTTSHGAPEKSYRIYFDSPAEDPLGSDPLEPPDYELDLDYDRLGFRWEKFDRSTEYAFSRNLVKSSSLIADARDEEASSVGGNEDDSRATEVPDYSLTCHDLDTHDSSRALSPMRVSEAGRTQGEEASLSAVATIESKPTQENSSQVAAFAPAPGIFISPLRNENELKSEPEAAPERALERNTDSNEDMKIVVNDNDHETIFPIPFTLPRTPPNQIARGLPRTPVPRHTSMSHLRVSSLPPIAVLHTEDDDADEILDVESDPKLSQTSHDTIESWSAP